MLSKFILFSNELVFFAINWNRVHYYYIYPKDKIIHNKLYHGRFFYFIFHGNFIFEAMREVVIIILVLNLHKILRYLY